MSFASNTESHAWWAALRHEGLLLDESRLRELFPDYPLPLNAWRADHLRKALVTFQATPEETDARTGLITHLLEQVIGLDQHCGGTWQRGSTVPVDLSHRSVTGENIKPQHLWTHEGSPSLPVFISPDTRLGVGHGKRTAARVIEWMRAKQTRLALLTNGHQWRIIYAHGDSSAWCESDSTQWFLEGQPAPQLDALRLLLDPRVLHAETPDADKPTSPLLTAIAASRRGQSELSAILGERVRLAVEKLIASHGPAFLAQADAPARQDIYVAACRIVLRLVFTLFAEARDLLPRGNPIYWQSYSLGGLLEQLLRVGAGSARERLRHRFSAWPRLIALGRLVHAGSPHEALPLLPYGGELFAPGDAASTDGISRALAIFESACLDKEFNQEHIMPDSEVLEVLTLITRTQTVIRQGRGRTTVTVPVDFSDLSSEYIGILYEGLLDYELRCVTEDEAAVLFLAIGHEPALPLARLEQMNEQGMKDLVEAFKKAAKAPAGEGEEESEDTDDIPADEEPLLNEEDPSDLPEQEATSPEPDTTHSVREAARARAFAWAKKAVVEGGLVPSPRRGRAAAADDYEQRLTATARKFISRLILPGEWYLVRWGGTRKGSGSFYTRPGLATPTIRRTLEPLAYERSDTGTLIPRSPQAILALKTCDPSCGSGTFPVGTLRYLTEALFQSVFHHGWLIFGEDRQTDGTTRLVIKPGPTATTQPVPAVLESLLKEVRLRAIDDESRLRAWLKRLVVENCLYGVDLDPLAIELARLALWVETMDPSLPFTFLDHKFRCGNGLVGAWLDTFQHYPVMAWHREGGDKNHTNFHHHFREKTGKKGTSKVGDVWTEAIKTQLDNVIRPSLRSYIEETTQPVFALLAAIYEPNHLLDQALAAFADIHTHVDDPAAQRTAFQQWLDSPPYQNLRTSLDLWCALWFWPADRLAAAPTPQNFSQPTAEALAIVEELHRAHRFFHWELEFPDVFGSGTREAPGGFHALLGNPPWEIQKPNSKEFFSNVDPLYRTYGKQDALDRQMELFAANRTIEDNWLRYTGGLKALSHFTKHAAYPFGDPQDNPNESFHFTLVPRRAADDATLHARWRPKRKSISSFADPAHPYRDQGGADINTYKLFLELFIALSLPSGRIGIICPSGVHNDLGSLALRQRWLPWVRLIVKFDNERKIFSGLEHNSKFDVLVLGREKQNSSSGGEFPAAFFSFRNTDAFESLEKESVNISNELVRVASPDSLSIPEVRNKRDVEVVRLLYANGEYGGDEIRPTTELHLTSDSGRFNRESGLPVYQGGMLWLCDHRYNVFRIESRSFERGKHEDVELRSHYPLIPKYWIQPEKYWQKFADRKKNGDWPYERYRIAYRVQSSRSNRRTFISAMMPRYCAAGNSIGIIENDSPSKLLFWLGCFCSYAFDFNVRTKISSNINSFYLPQMALPRLQEGSSARSKFVNNTLRLVATSTLFQPLIEMVTGSPLNMPLHRFMAVSDHERARLFAINDAIVFHAFGFSEELAAHVLSTFTGVDPNLDPELRHTVLAQVAYADLCAQGLDAFLTGPDGDGWQLPETLRLADYGLGHDTRAQEPQPVAPRLGPRFLDWQLQKDPAQSWQECEAHARQLDALWSHARTLAGISPDGGEADIEADGARADLQIKPQSRLKKNGTNNDQPELF